MLSAVETKARIVASLLLLVSLASPWTILWGTNMVSGLTSQFYILEFPFMSFTIIGAGSEGTMSYWKPYQSGPKYLGTALFVIGAFLALMGSTKRKPDYYVEWGGLSSIVGLIFFSGSTSEEIFIPYALTQRYASLPVGMLIPAAFWFLIFLYQRPVTTTRGVSGLFCGGCGRAISPEFEYCPFCGMLTRGPKCPGCGIRVSVRHVFCPFCGAKIPKREEKPLVL